MSLRPFTGVVALVLLAGMVAAPVASKASDTEAELQSRLQNEHNPVKRAKYDIRLARMKLDQAIAAYDQSKLDAGVQLLDSYLQHMKDAWQSLRDSGRNAARKPQGFKELDIALREDMRTLDDLAHRVSFYDREPVQKVHGQIEGMRGEVLRALFPADRSPTTRDQHARPSGQSWLETPRRGVSTLRWGEPPGLLPRGQDILSDEEDAKIREAQDPSERIQTYLEFTQARLDHLDEWRQKPVDTSLDIGAYLGKMLDQYVALTDEMKNWIQVKYDHQDDMRRGLRKLMEVGPKQLEELRRIQTSPGPYAADYSKSLGDAIDDLADTLDGAAQALQSQEKRLGELKKQEKADARATKVREKEEKKRIKEEKKLQKRERKRHVPGEDED